jgi:hypothetical protein
MFLGAQTLGTPLPHLFFFTFHGFIPLLDFYDLLTQIFLSFNFVDGQPWKHLQQQAGDACVDQGVTYDQDVKQGFA